MSAAAELPVSKAVVRDTVALIRDHVRFGRGLSPRQTMRLNHASSEVGGKDPLPTAAATEDAGSLNAAPATDRLTICLDLTRGNVTS
jgi:hypothetical protein